jgi:superfamily II DNA or RNA helicase
LERRHRDLGNGPAKALIVARSQDDARRFQETTDRLMRERGLRPIAELAVSSEMDAHQVLERFRRLERPGVLCTVDMAGEGYDCPDIAVVGFATNKLTPLYVRQVVARAQRVTAYEREKIKRPIPAAVIIPDIPELVKVMSSILEPMRHELRDPIEDRAEHDPNEDAQQQLAGMETLGLPKFHARRGQQSHGGRCPRHG